MKTLKITTEARAYSEDEAKNYIEEFKLNNYSHFEEFYNETSKQVYFTALGILKDHALAEDITQDTYVSFLDNVENYKYENSIYGYLTIIARNKSINIYNKNKRITYDDELLNNVKTPIPEKNNDLDIDEILSLIEKEEEREIVIYHIVLDYTFKEIANIMHKPLGTILWKYNKTIKYLREKVTKYEK